MLDKVYHSLWEACVIPSKVVAYHLICHNFSNLAFPRFLLLCWIIIWKSTGERAQFEKLCGFGRRPGNHFRWKSSNVSCLLKKNQGMFPALKSCTFAPSTFGSGQGKCFHIYWSLCCYRSSILPVETQRGPFFYCPDVLTSCCTRGESMHWICCRVFSLCFGLTMMCLVYEAKVFHVFCAVFYRFSHCQDRALERDRPQQRKKGSQWTNQQHRHRETVKISDIREMNPLVFTLVFSALEEVNLFVIVSSPSQLCSTVMVDIVFARFMFCTFYWRWRNPTTIYFSSSLSISIARRTSWGFEFV